MRYQGHFSIIAAAIFICIPVWCAAQDEVMEGAAAENPALAQPAAETPPPAAMPTPAASSPSAEPMTELILFSDIMISTATKRMQRVSEIPANITIITGEEVREMAALTLTDVLFHVTGTYFDYSSVLPTTRLHGIATFQNGNILLLINGRKVNIPEWGQFDNDFGINTLTNVKRIEIIKGPGAALYGANAFAGIINIITNEGKDIRGLRTKAGVGHLNRGGDLSQYYMATYGDQNGDWDYVVDASYWQQFGNMQADDGPLHNFFLGKNASAALRYKDEWFVQGGFNKMDAPLLTDDPTSIMVHGITNGYLTTKYDYTVNEQSKISVHLEDTYYNKYYPGTQGNLEQIKIRSGADVPSDVTAIGDMMGNTYPVPANITGYYMTMDTYMELLQLMSGPSEQVKLGGTMNELLAEVQYDLAFPENNYILAGISYRLDRVDYNALTADVVSDNNYAFFLQDEYQLLDNLSLLAGGRYDYNSEYGSNVSPKGSIHYAPLDGLKVKLMYGTAFREPSLYERHSYPETGELNPETLSQSEVNVEYTYGQLFQTKASYYYAETKDEIGIGYESAPLYIYTPNLSLMNPMLPPQPGLFSNPFLTAFIFRWVNTGQYFYKGGEFEGTLYPADFLSLKVNYSRPVIYQVGMPYPEQDLNLVNAVLGLKWKDLLFFNFYAHSLRMPSAVMNPSGDYYNEYRWTKRYDVSVGGQYENLSLTLAVFNILDEFAYYYAARTYREHRSWRLMLEYALSF
ncbi:TonB-dependent receptor [candidate division FCPU426 bacterium]|nr:TonB-dependent receptor [candidate division FCPU426 bacterium]